MRQFNHDDDDTDYDDLRRSRAEDRESIKEIRESLKVNEDDLFAKLVAAAQAASPEQRRAAAQKAALIDRRGGITAKGRSEVDTSAFDRIGQMSQQHEVYASAPVQNTRYAEVLDTLDRFKFSADDDRRKRQMKIVAQSLRTALQELVLEEVAVNTKNAFKGHAEKVVKAPGGLKVYFNFGEGKQWAVTAKGGFYGDETICVHATNGKIRAAVLRIEGEDHTDLSSSFEIGIAPYKGEK